MLCKQRCLLQSTIGNNYMYYLEICCSVVAIITLSSSIKVCADPAMLMAIKISLELPMPHLISPSIFLGLRFASDVPPRRWQQILEDFIGIQFHKDRGYPACNGSVDH